MPRNLYALILAGGGGERFWPLSRRSHPKQLLSLVAQESLLESTIARLSGLVPPERILVLTNKDQEKAVRSLLPQLPEENIVIEPVKRDTAAAVALGAGLISRRDRHATMAVLPADQSIRDVAGFQRTLRAAASAATATSVLVTIGIQPSWASPLFGYIERGERAIIPGMEACPEIYEVRRFREKPNVDLAESFLSNERFRWNTGMFVWTVQSILGALDRHVPELAHFVTHLHETKKLAALIESRYASLPQISIDYAVLEKASRVLEVEALFDWDDVGNWEAAAKYWPKDRSGNSANGAMTAEESTDNIVFAHPGLHVTLLGVRDLIVIQSQDALLVCNRREVDKIKRLVHRLPPELQ